MCENTRLPVTINKIRSFTGFKSFVQKVRFSFSAVWQNTIAVWFSLGMAKQFLVWLIPNVKNIYVSYSNIYEYNLYEYNI